MMYYRMSTNNLELTTDIIQESGPSMFLFVGGKLYNSQEGPVRFKFSYEDFLGNEPLEYIDGNNLMSHRLVSTLEKAGVNNLQKFEAELLDRQSGTISRNFYVVNIVGLVAATDLTKSRSLPLAEGHVFIDLTIHRKQSHGLFMFRLAESLIDLIVHEKVANMVEKENHTGIVFSPV